MQPPYNMINAATYALIKSADPFAIGMYISILSRSTPSRILLATEDGSIMMSPMLQYNMCNQAPPVRGGAC